MSSIRVEAFKPSSTVLLMVDFVNLLDFPGAEDIAASAVEAATRTARLRRRLSREGVRVIYANDNYGLWTSDFKALWQRCARRPGPAGQIAKRIAPQAKDLILLKPRHSAFYATPLDLLLEQLRCRRLVITGIAADSCVFFSAMDAYLRGYSLCIPPDCVAAESAEARDKALEQMARVLKADVRASDAIKIGT
ncbi:MAG TPA: isochorismatase family cysteine hydrolase [Roseateles sp.]